MRLKVKVTTVLNGHETNVVARILARTISVSDKVATRISQEQEKEERAIVHDFIAHNNKARGVLTEAALGLSDG